MRVFDLAAIQGVLRQPLSRAMLLSLCLHLAVLALVQVRPMAEPENEQVIELRLAVPAGQGEILAKHLPQSIQADAMPTAAQADTVENRRAAPAPEPAGPALALPALFDAHWYAAREVDVHPTVLGRIQPIYPDDARRQGLEGWVKLRLKLDERGRVLETEVVEAQPPGVFDAAAVEAFSRARFEPARKQGVPVRYEGFFRVMFELE